MRVGVYLWVGTDEAGTWNITLTLEKSVSSG